MKMNEFLKKNKWHILSGVVFLAIFAVIAGVFSHGMDNKLDSLKDQMDRISSGISSLEASSAAFKSSVDEIAQKSGAETYGTEPSVQLADPELQSKLDGILSQLSDLKKAVASLKVSSNVEKQPAKSTEETVTVPDTKAPESPANPTGPDRQTQSQSTVKKGQDFTITVKANEVSNLYGYQFNLNYDNKKVTYKGSLKSSISEIGTIFKKDMTDHLLVGATMTGNRPGYSNQNVTVCTMVFTAAADIDSSAFTIDSVNTVDANQNYVENINGWSIDAKAN
jgi:outer membrane murein-binding lipoprotein Lpp